MTKFEYLCRRVADTTVTPERYGRSFTGFVAQLRTSEHGEANRQMIARNKAKFAFDVERIKQR